MRPIDADALIESLGQWQRDAEKSPQGYVGLMEFMMALAQAAVAQIPTLTIDDLRKKGEANWISVRERLPKDNQRVLICYKHPCNKSVKMLNLAFFQEIGKYDFVDGKRNVFCYDSDDWGHRPYKHVTHWMPLPEPPKEEA